MTFVPRRELALAAVCAGLLMMEICLTKIFSIVLWYHFGFLAVSTALLGFASSGVYLAWRGVQERAENADRSIARAAGTAALVAVASLWLVTQTTFDVYSVIQDRTLGVLLALVLWVTLPFFFLGLVISRTLTAFPERVGSLYAADLIGSAGGCGLAVLLLSNDVSGPAAILVGALLVGVGGMLFAGTRPTSLLWATIGAAVPAVALVTADPEQTFPLLSPKSKPLYRIEHLDQELRDRGKPAWRRGRLTLKDGSVLEIETPFPPVISDDGKRVHVETDDGPLELPIDQIAPASDGEGLAFETTDWHVFRRWSSTSRVDAFHWPKVHGPWGLWGLSNRYRAGSPPTPRQKGITIDAWAMTSIMRYSGEPLQPAGTPAVDAERAKLGVLEYLPAGTVFRVKPKPERIVCIGAGGGLDLLTAKYFGAGHITGVELNSGVVAASREAFAAFSGHLYDHDRHPDVEVHVAEGRHFLERSPERFDVVQLSGVDTFSTSEAGAFSLTENFLYTVEAFETYFDHLRPDGVVTLTRWFYPVLRGEGPDAELVPRYSLRLLALARTALLERDGAVDPHDGIFFLKSENFTVILVKPEGFSEADAATLNQHCERYGFQVLYSPHRRTEKLDYIGQTFANPFQAFMDAEDPDAFLEATGFDVNPPRDDRPFFFEVSRFHHIFAKDHYLNPLGGLTAHGILILLFAEVLLLGLLFVILPLRRLPGAGERGGRRLHVGLLLYFTAIGFGFIVVEIVLTQKFVLFLGHPFYALSVILFSVLLFSGLGSALSARMPLPRFTTLLAGALALAPAFFYDPVFKAALHQPLGVRIALSVALLAPLGLVMGMPFPTGIRVLAARRAELIPWAWGINGYTSVLGSVLAVILGIELGFETVLQIAAAVYALGVLGYSLMHAAPLPHEDDAAIDFSDG